MAPKKGPQKAKKVSRPPAKKATAKKKPLGYKELATPGNLYRAFNRGGLHMQPDKPLAKNNGGSVQQARTNLVIAVTYAAQHPEDDSLKPLRKITLYDFIDDRYAEEIKIFGVAALCKLVKREQFGELMTSLRGKVDGFAWSHVFTAALKQAVVGFEYVAPAEEVAPEEPPAGK